MEVTIKEVAEMANVSPSTVSRVLSGSSKISRETQDRVMKAVEKLNYHPNIIARSLANNSTNILGLVLPSQQTDLFKNPFFIQIMKGISVCAQKNGYYIMYSFGKDEEEQLKYINNYTRSRLVDGIILLTSRTDDKCIKYLYQKEFPFVVVGRPGQSNDILWVDNDNFQAMYKVVSYLISKGHSNIAYIGGPEDRSVSMDRFDGYRRALRANGFLVNEKIIQQRADYSEKEGYESMKEILKCDSPSAVVTTDDLFAFGANKYMQEKNIKDIALVGFNNTQLSQYQNPPLSSVDINADKLGYCAAKLLIYKLEKRELPANHYLVETNLVERESSK